MRYVMRIAELSESSNLWTQIALPGIPGSMPLWVSVLSISPGVFANTAGGTLSFVCPIRSGSRLKDSESSYARASSPHTTTK